MKKTIDLINTIIIKIVFFRAKRNIKKKTGKIIFVSKSLRRMYITTFLMKQVMEISSDRIPCKLVVLNAMQKRQIAKEIYKYYLSNYNMSDSWDVLSVNTIENMIITKYELFKHRGSRIGAIIDNSCYLTDDEIEVILHNHYTGLYGGICQKNNKEK